MNVGLVQKIEGFFDASNKFQNFSKSFVNGIHEIELDCVANQNVNLQNLTIFKKYTLTSITHYKVSNCPLPNISRKNFQNLDSLRYLHLVNNSIQLIRPQLFFDLTNIEVVNLSNNLISVFNEKTFLTLIALEQLDISYNRFQIFKINLFANNSKLTEIKVLGNNITSFDLKYNTKLVYNELKVLEKIEIIVEKSSTENYFILKTIENDNIRLIFFIIVILDLTLALIYTIKQFKFEKNYREKLENYVKF